jgi:MinD-like ATPase involved in chromosome partitioning or flagellar assembly
LDGRRVLVGGFGGGSGRTTVAIGLGMALASRRGGRVVAVDACPDQGGPLADRAGVPGRGVGLRELAATPSIASLAEVRRFLATAESSGLEVLPGLRDLTGPGLTAAEAAWVIDLLERLFPTVVVDGPPGWTQPVSAVLLARADTVVLTARAEPSVGRGWRGLARPAAPEPTRLTEAGCAQDALTALAAVRADLPACTVVVHVETTPPANRPVPRRLAARSPGGEAAALVEAVHSAVTIPFDPALAGGAPLDWAQLRPRTREAFTLLAATVDEAPLGPIEPVPNAAAARRTAGGLPGARPRPRLDPPDDPTMPRLPANLPTRP